ncbi:uncharacterized protein METZ01_LOCUS101258, partial [marine metagenome]
YTVLFKYFWPHRKKVYYNDTTTTDSVPNLAEDAWNVFSFDYAFGSFTASDNMSSSTSSSGVF